MECPQECNPTPRLPRGITRHPPSARGPDGSGLPTGPQWERPGPPQL